MFAFSIFLTTVHFHILVEMQEIYDFPKPIVSLNPSYGVFLEGEATSVNCSCQCPVTRVQFFYNSICHHKDLHEGQCETSLPLTPLNRGKASYMCECLFLLENGTWRRSGLTDPVQIHVGDQLSKPNIKALSDSDANSSRDIVSISCQGDIRPSGGIFSFYNSRRKDFRQEYHVTGLEDTAVITINIHEHSSAGNYSCRYKTEVNGRSILSPFSQSVSVTEKRKDDHTSKGQNKRQNIPRTASTAVQITDSKDQDGIYDNANLIYCNSMGEYSKVHDNNCESVTYAALNIEVSNQNTSASVVREELCMYMDVKT
ncbi:uncharacterized protein LOC122544524 isoform X2 [Chiloscyllium plagiosum]|uniref:uncharacterized protein LOC122544524 isoform X2 n=1 Tax=Chiloscyllium plagiosum TaxID=36176 RepID=UPI001CB85782|nr:uncharacterized protein LOC122544524 isoform X2 [Chiloscyllium plagiosum]